eukprot:NODE_193_length_15440_cov_0.478587.p10 type:complete len:106 gc:universal NODE_193_length_15440_cov_0.478587:10071-10388(+)
MDGQDLQRLQHIAEVEMQEKLQETTSESEDGSVESMTILQEEIEMLETDPQGKPEILTTKTRGKKIDFKLAEQRMSEEINLFNSKNNLDPMEVEDEDEEYVAAEE